MQIENKIAEMGLELPDLETEYRTTPSKAKFYSHVAAGNLLYLAGAVPTKDGKPFMPGVLGKDLSVEQGAEAARHCALCVLSVVKYALGDLDRVDRFVQMISYVNSAPGFIDQPRVTNTATELLFELYGERGVSTRASIGCQGLAFNHSVELITTLLFTGDEVRAPLRRDHFLR